MTRQAKTLYDFGLSPIHWARARATTLQGGLDQLQQQAHRGILLFYGEQETCGVEEEAETSAPITFPPNKVDHRACALKSA